MSMPNLVAQTYKWDKMEFQVRAILSPIQTISCSKVETLYNPEAYFFVFWVDFVQLFAKKPHKDSATVATAAPSM